MMMSTLLNMRIRMLMRDEAEDNDDKKDLILLIEERERESQTTSCNNDDDGLKENVLRPSNDVVKFNLTFSGTF